jgi:hypothetical protein
MRKNSKVNEALSVIAESLPLVSVHSIVMGMKNRELTEYEALLLVALQARIDKEQEIWLEGNAWREISKKRRSELLAEAILKHSEIARMAGIAQPA